jgi:hypothetical protein
MDMTEFVRRSLLLATIGLSASCATNSTGEPARPDTMEIDADDIAALVSDLEKGANAWVQGRLEDTASTMFSQSEDMVLFGPFGGPPLKGKVEWGKRQAAAVQAFGGGRTQLELVDWFAGGDLAVLVLIERGEVFFEGQSEPQPWILRTTQAFRRAGPEKWVRLSRHADPLIDFRPQPATAKLARGD